MDGPEVENCTGYRIGGGIKYFAKQAINQLIDMLSGVPDGDVVMIAAQRTLTSNSAPDEMLDLCFALEEFGWGESRNQSVLRHANTTDGYVFIGRRNSSSFTEERLGTRFAELTKIDFDTGLKLETSSLIDIDSPQNNAVKLRIRKIFPDISVIEKVSSWQPDDKVVVASTDFKWDQAEIKTIKAISGNNIQFHDGLDYTHFDEVVNRVDERGEVAMLSRNIVIQGKVVDDDHYFGGHLKVIRYFKNVHIEGVEFYQMGQPSSGNYPISFHLCHDIDNGDYPLKQYIRNNSIHHSFARCLTILGTHGLYVEDNVCWDTFGHGYVLAEGGEKRTVFDGNFGGGQRKINFLDEAVDANLIPATYWLTNPQTYVRNNVAAGSDGHGFWFIFPKQPINLSADKNFMQLMEADSTAIYEFNNNVAHSNGDTGLYIDRRLASDGSVKAALNEYFPKHPGTNDAEHAVINRMTAYKNAIQNVWTRHGPFMFLKASLADSLVAITMSGYVDDKTMLDSVVVGETDNFGEPSTWMYNGTKITYNRSLPDTSSLLKRGRPYQGIIMYQAQNNYTRVWMDGFKNSDFFKAGAIGFKRSNYYPNSPESSTSEILFGFKDEISSGNRVYDDFNANGFDGEDGNRVSIFRDLDGSVTSFADQTVVESGEFFLTSDCYMRTNWKMGVCSAKHGVVRSKITSGQAVGSFMIREDLANYRLEMSSRPFAKGFIVQLGGDYTYTLHYLSPGPSQFELVGMGVELGLHVRIGVCIGPNVNFKISLSGLKIVPWASFSKATNLTELDADDTGEKYLYNDFTGMLYMKLMSNIPRSKSDRGDCPGGSNMCPKYRVTILDATTYSGDCLAYLNLTNSEPTVQDMDNVVLSSTAQVPPEEWGAGETKPFLSRQLVNGSFSQWSAWTQCPVECGGGSQSRQRFCDSPAPRNGGKPCEGLGEEHQSCGTALCPQDGVFTEWSIWTPCAAICDNGCDGFQRRHRMCEGPINGGIYCEGCTSQVRACQFVDT